MKTLNSQNVVGFNFNHSAYGQITDEGWKYLENTVSEDYIKHCITPQAVELKGEVWYELPLWKWFELFQFNPAGPLLFGTRMLFKESDFNSL